MERKDMVRKSWECGSWCQCKGHINHLTKGQGGLMIWLSACWREFSSLFIPWWTPSDQIEQRHEGQWPCCLVSPCCVEEEFPPVCQGWTGAFCCNCDDTFIMKSSLSEYQLSLLPLHLPTDHQGWRKLSSLEFFGSLTSSKWAKVNCYWFLWGLSLLI